MVVFDMRLTSYEVTQDPHNAISPPLLNEALLRSAFHFYSTAKFKLFTEYFQIALSNVLELYKHKKTPHNKAYAHFSCHYNNKKRYLPPDNLHLSDSAISAFCLLYFVFYSSFTGAILAVFSSL